ncbi:restriction endonuclease subunit S [Burkholderia gladioli]|uniref:restriction endonuclease subunit S n=1 Tax=Burkholderia gladioli TaxID=28095 RepID=UPI00163EEB32|nr:restriction endonuclease subunit S [Burkholderia gladioli]
MNATLTPLEDVCISINSGGTPSRQQASYWDGGTIPWIKTGELNDWKVQSIGEKITEEGLKNSSAKIYAPGTVLIAMYGDGKTITTMGIVDKPSATNQACCALVADPRICDPLYLFYALKDRRSGLLNLVVAGAQRNLSVGIIRKFPILLHSLENQRRIAGILGAYDDLIEVNRRRIAVLEEMARGLFTEWFTRPRFPGYEDVAVEETPDGPLPVGWSWVQLGTLIELIYGKALKADTRQPGDVAVIGSSGVVGSHNAVLVSGPGIVVGRKGNVGSVIWSSGDFWPIDTTYYVDTELPLPYIYQLLKRVPFQNTDAAVPGLNRDYALSRMVLVAPSALVQRYGDFAAPIHEAVTKLEQANANLAAARDVLLPRLISGQLSVTQAQRELEAA